MPDLHAKQYYIEHAEELGWGHGVARLNPERVELLDRYVVGNRVLDVACGSGIYTDYLASKGYDAWGVDLVDDFIEEAEQTRKGHYVQGVADRLPFADKEFATVLLLDILEHGDDMAILREAKRVASARILVNVPRKVDRDLEQSGVVFRHYLDRSHLREYRQDELVAMAQKLDLKVAGIVENSPVDPIAVYKALFSGNRVLVRAIKILIKLLLRRRRYCAAYFAVLDL